MSKYEIEIAMSITKEGSEEPMAVTNQVYSNLEYFAVLGIQKAVVNALLGLGDAQLAATPKK
jgi:hypothetical protein